MKNNIIGIFERVSLPELGVNRLIAKIDTGAYTGSLHVVNIEITKNNRLRFQPVNSKHNFVEFKDFQKYKIRSSNGTQEERYVVLTTIVIDGKEYAINISLTDRSSMKRDLLVGRSFLKKNKLLVDVNKGIKYVRKNNQ